MVEVDLLPQGYEVFGLSHLCEGLTDNRDEDVQENGGCQECLQHEQGIDGNVSTRIHKITCFDISSPNAYRVLVID